MCKLNTSRDRCPARCQSAKEWHILVHSIYQMLRATRAWPSKPNERKMPDLSYMRASAGPALCRFSGFKFNVGAWMSALRRAEAKGKELHRKGRYSNGKPLTPTGHKSIFPRVKCGCDTGRTMLSQEPKTKHRNPDAMAHREWALACQMENQNKVPG